MMEISIHPVSILVLSLHNALNGTPFHDLHALNQYLIDCTMHDVDEAAIISHLAIHTMSGMCSLQQARGAVMGQMESIFGYIENDIDYAVRRYTPITATTYAMVIDTMTPDLREMALLNLSDTLCKGVSMILRPPYRLAHLEALPLADGLQYSYAKLVRTLLSDTPVDQLARTLCAESLAAAKPTQLDADGLTPYAVDVRNDLSMFRTQLLNRIVGIAQPDKLGITVESVHNGMILITLSNADADAAQPQ